MRKRGGRIEVTARWNHPADAVSKGGGPLCREGPWPKATARHAAPLASNPGPCPFVREGTMRNPKLVLFLSVLLLPALMLRASADEAIVVERAFREAQEPLRDRAWADAAKALADFRAAHPTAPQAREALVLEADARLRAKDAQAALVLATRGIGAPEGAQEDGWSDRLRHTAAAAYEALGKPGDAAKLLRLLSDHATSPQVRTTIALRHKDLGDRDFAGVKGKDDLGREVVRKNHDRATQSYQLALQTGLPEADERAVFANLARIADGKNQHAQAITWWSRVLKSLAWDEKKRTIPAPSERDAALQAALAGRGKARLRTGDVVGAREDLRAARTLAERTNSEQMTEIVHLMASERFRVGDDVAFEEGIDLLRGLLAKAGSDAAEATRKLLANTYAKRNMPLKAAGEWRAFVERHPNSPFAAQARHNAAQMLAAVGRHEEAIAEWTRFLAAHPNHQLWAQVRQAIPEATFAIGVQRKKDADPDGAIAGWRKFIQEYPTHPKAPVALAHIADTQYERDDFEAAMATWKEIGGRYAGSPQAPGAALRVAKTLEDDLQRLDAAIVAYETVVKQFGKHGVSHEARQRLDRLRAKHLEVVAERVVGTDVTPVVRVITRNIEALKVRVYRLGLEEYFRRKGTIEGVQALQLEIVKPDWTSEWKMDPYEPLRLISAERPLPMKGAGAYVIVAGNDDLTSTTLMLVSDIECVVKRSRDTQLFVWAFDRKTQQPVAGARVIASSGGDVGVTGADGVWQGKPGHDAKNVLVVAPSKSMAATEIADGTSRGRGFVSKAYVYTDRPVYRPGHEMKWRAMFLRARGGSYQPPAQHKAVARIFDARGNEVSKTELTSSDFGTFDGAFSIDRLAPLGTWRVQLAMHKVGTWDGSFEVQAYRKPSLTIRVDPKKSVFATGETIEARLAVRYAFGGPAAHVPVRYDVWRRAETFTAAAADDYGWYFKDERNDRKARVSTANLEEVARGELTTDDAGHAAFEVPTRELDADAEYIVRAHVRDVTGRWISDQDRIPVTRRDYMAVVKTERKVYRPKQELTLEVRTVDALERPVARSGEVKLLRLREVRVTDVKKRGGRWQSHAMRVEEIPVSRYALSVGATGTAEMRLSLPGPGRWRLRWEGRDARGAPVTAFADVDAAGEAEDLSKDARLISARTLYREGEDAELYLQSPVTDVRALFTVEAEGVLDYRFVDIKTSSTPIALALPGRYAPNVYLSIAIPGEGRLIEAKTEVIVLRHLDVSLKITPETALPGADVEVEVITKDANGKPVSAEVGLSLVDETVFAIARDQAPRIRPYFYDQRRLHAVASASSLGAQLVGITRETNRDLLDQAAARSGRAREMQVRSSLRLAQESLERGDFARGVKHLSKALDADPGSVEGRRMLALMVREAQNKGQLDEIAKSGTLALLRDVSKDKADAKLEDSFEESEGLSDAPFEGPQNNATIGIGGGAGGAFSGRGGGRRKGLANEKARRPRLRAPTDTPPPPGAILNRQAEAEELLGHTEIYNARFQGMDQTPALAAAYADQAAVFVPAEVRKTFSDTAHWGPRVRTDDEGRARVKVKLPDNLTTWRAVVRGISKQALVGSGRGSLAVRQPVIVRIDPPRFLTQGDEITIPIAVHNQTEAALKGPLQFTAEGIELRGENDTLDIEPGSHALSERVATAPAIGPVTMEATFGSAGAGDGMKAGFPSLPRGIRVVDARSGVIDTQAADTQETFLDVPERVIAGSQHLVVALHPGVDDALMDALLHLELFPYGCVEQTVHRFLPALMAYDALRAAGHPAADQLTNLHEGVARAAERLRNLQNTDGSFGWFQGGQGDLAMTAYALRGLVGARQAGVPGLDRVIDGARNALARLLPQGTPDAQALAHLAWAEAGGFDAKTWAITFRKRSDELSTAGLAWLTMAAAQRNRGYDVDELARLLIERRQESDGQTYWRGRRHDCFSGSDYEATALAALALVRAKIASPHPERAVAWLLASRPGGPRARATTKENAAFIELAAAWLRDGRDHGFGGTVDVLVDGAVVRTVQTGPGTLALGDRRFLVDGEWSAGRHTVAFRLKGQGALHWTARWTGVVASKDLPADPHGITVNRNYLDPEQTPAPGEQPKPKPGYDVLREAARPRFEPKMKEVVAQGETVLVRLTIRPSQSLEYVLVEDPLPAGFEVVDDTTKGPFAWQERRDDKQVFFLSNLPAGGVLLEYHLQATHLGSFTALGTEASAMYAPEFHGRAPGYRLSIRRGDTAAGGEREPTPDELFATAMQMAKDGEHESARSIFEALKQQPLRDDIVAIVETQLLVGAIARKDAKEIVRAREALVRRDPARIPKDFDSERSISQAYESEGDVEVAAGLYRGLIARGFGLERVWGKRLEAFEREADGLDHIGIALRRFPVSNATAQAAFERARRYAEVTRPEGRPLPKGKPMDSESIDALLDATAHFASTASAPQLGYALVQSARQAGDLSGAAQAAEAFLRRFPDHRLADEVWLFLADVRFRAFEDAPTPKNAAAVDAAAQPLIQKQFPNDAGRLQRSPHRAHGYHLMARVRHVMGDLAGAVKYYDNARSIEDAAEALAWLREKRLDIDATRNVALGEPLAFALRYRNVAEATLKAYPVDLQVLFAIRKTLDGLHQIDLSGIVPAREWKQALPDAGDFREHEAQVTIPDVPSEAGVWLVVVKTDKLERSTLLVRSDLHVELQRLGSKVRVHVTGPDGRGVGGAFVTVSDGSKIRARGLTDGRGSFEAPGVGPRAFVVVSKGDRYGVAR